MEKALAPANQKLPENLPSGARAFQAAIDGKLTQDTWSEILQAQIEKAKQGDCGAAKFLLEYAGGVASMRGATFVQETHHHEHYHEADDKKPSLKANAGMKLASGDVPDRSTEEYEAERARTARRTAARVGAGA